MPELKWIKYERLYLPQSIVEHYLNLADSHTAAFTNWARSAMNYCRKS